MRNLILCLALLFSVSAFADWNSFLQTPLGGYVRAGIQLSSSLERNRGSRSGGIIQAKDEDQCLDEFKKSQKNWEKKSGLVNAAYLLSSISHYDIQKGGENTTSHNFGLQKGTKLRVNSWSPVDAPHMNSQCREFWKVKDNFIADSGEEKCRIVTMAMKDNTYNLLYCIGSNHIQIDPNKSYLVEFRDDDHINNCK